MDEVPRGEPGRGGQGTGGEEQQHGAGDRRGGHGGGPLPADRHPGGRLAEPRQEDHQPRVLGGVRPRRDAVLHVAAQDRLRRVRVGLGPLTQNIRRQLLLRRLLTR